MLKEIVIKLMSMFSVLIIVLLPFILVSSFYNSTPVFLNLLIGFSLMALLLHIGELSVWFEQKIRLIKVFN